MKRGRLCREIDNIFGGIPGCFLHVLLEVFRFFVRAEICMNLPWSLVVAKTRGRCWGRGVFLFFFFKFFFSSIFVVILQ